MSDRIAVMNAGVIEQCGTPEDIYERPTSVFSAGFIGTSNLMTGTYSHGNLSLGPGVQFALPNHPQLSEGSITSVAIRPEKIWMSDLTDSMTQLSGVIATTVYHGATTQYIVTVAPGVELTVLEQNLARSRNEDRWTDGDRVDIGWAPEHCLVLS